MSRKIKISLAEANPELAAQWHRDKNGSLTPYDVAPNSGKKVWWLLPYDDDKTGNHFDFEWEATIDRRNRGCGCPFLSSSAIWTGYNDLYSVNPSLANEWHPTKNFPLTPYDVMANSHKKVWWLLSYDDPNTGKHFYFEWEAKIDCRNKGTGCPYLSGQAIWIGFNDLQSVNPELARQWHPTRNGDLTPQQVTANTDKKVWWFLQYDDPRTNQKFDFEWKASVSDRNSGSSCPYLVNAALWPLYNSLAIVEPIFAKEFDTEKNGGLTAHDILYCSGKSYWWKCKKGHRWRNTVSDRHYKRYGCPHCAKERQTSFPEQVIYYYIKKKFGDAINGDRKAIDLELDVYVPSIKIAIEYDGEMWHNDINKDLKKNDECKKHGIRLIRIREKGCPSMTENDNCIILEIKHNNNKELERAILKIAEILQISVDVDIHRDLSEIQSLIDYSERKHSLAELFPDVAKELHATKNGNLTADCIHAYSQKTVWWCLSYLDPKRGKTFQFEWTATVASRTRGGNGCPYLTNTRAWPEFNDLLTLRPEIAREWNYDKNHGLTNKRNDDISTPDKVTENANQKVWWKCSRCNHEWQAMISNRSFLGRGCPECAKAKLKQPRKRKTVDQSEIIIDADDTTT